MKNLMTRRILFGMLMAFVLVFSVQGIASAQSVSVSGDGSTTSSSSGTTVITDYRSTPNIERSFTITISGVKNGETVNIAESIAGVTDVNAEVTDVTVTRAPSPQTKFDIDDDTATADDTAGGSDVQISPAKGSLGVVTSILFSGGLGKPDSPTGTGILQAAGRSR